MEFKVKKGSGGLCKGEGEMWCAMGKTRKRCLHFVASELDIRKFRGDLGMMKSGSKEDKLLAGRAGADAQR